MKDPGSWWIFQPRGRPRRHLTPLGVAWTLAVYLLVGLGSAEALRWLVQVRSPAGPVLALLLASAGWTLARVCADGQFVRGAAWLTGIGWSGAAQLLWEAPRCGSLVFGAGLPGVSPGIAPCVPHQDFMALVFVAGWLLLGPASALLLAGLDLYRWLRRDPLHAYRLLMD